MSLKYERLKQWAMGKQVKGAHEKIVRKPAGISMSQATPHTLLLYSR